MNIVYICNNNRRISPVLEELTNLYLEESPIKEHINISSKGIFPSKDASISSYGLAELIKKYGIQSKITPTKITQSICEKTDLILTSSIKQKKYIEKKYSSANVHTVKEFLEYPVQKNISDILPYKKKLTLGKYLRTFFTLPSRVAVYNKFYKEIDSKDEKAIEYFMNKKINELDIYAKKIVEKLEENYYKSDSSPHSQTYKDSPKVLSS